MGLILVQWLVGVGVVAAGLFVTFVAAGSLLCVIGFFIWDECRVAREVALGVVLVGGTGIGLIWGITYGVWSLGSAVLR